MEGRADHRLWNLPRGLAAGCLAGLVIFALDLARFPAREPEEFEAAAIILRRLMTVGGLFGLAIGVFAWIFGPECRGYPGVGRFVVAALTFWLAFPTYACSYGFITSSTAPEYIPITLLLLSFAFHTLLFTPRLGRLFGIPAILVFASATAIDLTTMPGDAERAIFLDRHRPVVQHLRSFEEAIRKRGHDPLAEVEADADFAATRRELGANEAALRTELKRLRGGRAPRHLVWIEYHGLLGDEILEQLDGWTLSCIGLRAAVLRGAARAATVWNSRYASALNPNASEWLDALLAAGLEEHPEQPRGEPYKPDCRALLESLPIEPEGDAGYFLRLHMQPDALPSVLEQLAGAPARTETLVVVTPFAVPGPGSGYYRHGAVFVPSRSDDWPTSWTQPAFFAYPGAGIEPRRIDLPTSEVDLLPTVLDLMDLSSPRPMQGQSLAAHLLDEPDPILLPVPFAYAEDLSAGREILAQIFIDDRYELDLDRKFGIVRLFDLADDPDRELNLVARRPDVVRAMLAKIKVIEEESRLLRSGKTVSDDFALLRERIRGGPITTRTRLVEEAIAKRAPGLDGFLLELLADPEQHYLVKLAVVERAGTMLGRDLLPALRELLRHAPAYGAKATALDLWLELDLPLEGEDREMAALAMQAHPLVGWRAGRLLAHHGDQRARLQLEPALQLGDAEISYLTMRSLRELGDERPLPPKPPEDLGSGAPGAQVLGPDRWSFEGESLLLDWRRNEAYQRGILLPEGLVAFLARDLDPILFGPELEDVGKAIEVVISFSIEGDWPESPFDLELFWRYPGQNQFFVHQRQTAQVAADRMERRLKFRIEPEAGKSPAQLRVDFFQEPHLVTIRAIRLRVAD